MTVKSLFRNLPDNCDIAYRNLFNAAGGRGKEAREYCEALWLRFYDLADRQFADRFPFEFHQRWFEMYMGATLRDTGLEVAGPKNSQGPDFCVTVSGRQIYIEAIAPGAGDPNNADYDKHASLAAAIKCLQGDGTMDPIESYHVRPLPL